MVAFRLDKACVTQVPAPAAELVYSGELSPAQATPTPGMSPTTSPAPRKVKGDEGGSPEA